MDLLHQIVTPRLEQLRNIFVRHQRDIRMVGGCVRDILSGKVPKDIDLCTNATPDEQTAIYNASRTKFIPTGIDHGTITVLLGSEQYEITSLRVETEHTGRHATVAFTHDWFGDLSRRDLTVNAMELTFDGELIDPFHGQEDLKNGIVRFVGDASQRIEEDYLRILRFVRFDGRLNQHGHVAPETVEAIRQLAPGMKQLSGERIWAEVQKILTGPNGVRQYQMLCDLGIAPVIDLPCRSSEALALAYQHTKSPITLLAAILASAAEANTVVNRWKLSGTERDMLLFLVNSKRSPVTLDMLKNLAVRGIHVDWLGELARLQGKENEAQQILHWQIPTFPVNGHDLMNLGIQPGIEMGKMLQALKKRWMESRFSLGKDELLTPNTPS